MLLLVQVILSESFSVFSCSFDVFKGEYELRVFLVYHLDSASSQFKLVIFSALLHVLEKAIRQRREAAKTFALPFYEREEEEERLMEIKRSKI